MGGHPLSRAIPKRATMALWAGPPLKRLEDPRLLTGRGVFVADLPLKEPYEEGIREALSAMLCRCTGYQGIVRAVKAAPARMRVAG